MRAALLLVVLAGCDRERRHLEEPPPAIASRDDVSLTNLYPGVPPGSPPVPLEYEESAWVVQEGARLYQQMNCVGCHAKGGGDIGPPLRDVRWIYGSDPENIFDTIVEGRPNGMPSYRKKLAAHDVWKLVAYVRSMSGLIPDDAPAARDDHIHAVPPPTLSEEHPPMAEPARHP